MLRLSPSRLLVIVFLATMFVLTAGPLIDTDLWWHLANGRYIVAHGIPTTDVYSFTAAGHTWVVHEWLTEVLMYWLYQAAGLTGLILVAAVVVAIGEFLVYQLLRGSGLSTSAAVALAVVLGLAASPSWGARPQLITFVLTALLLQLLIRYRERPGRWVLWLVLLFIVWANLHPGFLFGALLVLLFLAGETLRARGRAENTDGPARLERAALRRLAIVGGAGVLAGLLTPMTYQTYVAIFRVIASPVQRANIAEWASPDLHTLPGGMLVLTTLLLVVGGPLTARARPPDPAEMLLGLVTLALALTSQRNVALFAVAGAPMVGRAAAALLHRQDPLRVARPPSNAMSVLNWVVLALLAGLALAFRVLPNVAPASIDKTVAAQFPVAAVDHIATQAGDDPIFNAYEWGGYLVWRRYPAGKVFIDGRNEVYGDAVFSDYLTVAQLHKNAADVLDRYGVRTVLIQANHPLGALLRSSGWTLDYGDQVAEVYAREHA